MRAEQLVEGLVVDLGGLPVRLEAHEPRRAEAIAALLAGVREQNGPAAAVIRVVTDAPSMPARPPDEAYPDLTVWRSDSALALRHQSAMSAIADDATIRIGGDAADLALAVRRLFLPTATYLLADHDRFVLHAGTVAGAGGAWLVLGDTGAGKSTLVLAGLRSGWGTLGDDMAVVRPAGDALVVAGIPRPLAVPGDVLAEPPPGARSVQDVRRRVELPVDHLEPGWRPVAGVIVTAHGRADGGALEPIDAASALDRIVDAFVVASEPGLLRRFFPHAAALARLPAWRLEHDPDPAARLDAAAAFLARLRA